LRWSHKGGCAITLLHGVPLGGRQAGIKGVKWKERELGPGHYWLLLADSENRRIEDMTSLNCSPRLFAGRKRDQGKGGCRMKETRGVKMGKRQKKKGEKQK